MRPEEKFLLRLILFCLVLTAIVGGGLECIRRSVPKDSPASGVELTPGNYVPARLGE